jgi:hypothetical protein
VGDNGPMSNTNTIEAKLLPLSMAGPRMADALMGHIRAGGIVVMPSNEGNRIFDRRCLDRAEKAGLQLFKESGEGYRVRIGRGTVYAFHSMLVATTYKSS